MTLTPGRTSSRDLRTLFRFGALGGLTDGQLLERFATRRDEGAELAFAALVERHGPMVMRVCRGILRDEHEAMDACQATFLVLASRGHTLWVRDSLGPWLHRVACRASRRARAQEGRRRALERRAAESLGGGPDTDDRGDLAAILHEELDRLPDRYRVPIVLCDLEGRTCEEVAQHLGRPVGTVKSWRARGRERLRDRLSRRGLAGYPSVDIPSLTSPLPSLSCSTHEAIVKLAVGWRVTGAVPAAVLALTEGVLSSMLIAKFKAIALAILAVGAVAGSAGVFAYQPPTSNSDGPKPGAREEIAESKSDGSRPAQAVTRTYYVGDFFPPKARDTAHVDMRPIIDLITSSVAPGTWKVDDSLRQVGRAADDPPGALGSITPFFLSISLIIRHTAEVHDQIGNRLRLLRRIQELSLYPGSIPDRPEHPEVQRPAGHDKGVMADASRSIPGHSRDDRAKTASLEEVPRPGGDPTKGPATGTGERKAGRPTVGISELEAEGKTVSFQLSIGAGSKPLEIRGSFTVAPNKPADAGHVKSP